MIRAMDILQTAEKIMRGSHLSQPNSGQTYLMPGTYCTADIPGSGRRVYKILSLENEGNIRVKNVVTEKEYLIPGEYLSAIMTDSSNDIENITNFLVSDGSEDSPELEKLKVSQIGIKKPIESDEDKKSSGIDILGKSGGSYNRSRYNKTNQLVPIRTPSSNR